MDNLQAAIEAATKALEDKKAIDIKILDVHDLTILTDYFIIASSKNSNQIQAMADNVEETLTALGLKLLHIEGYQNATWILLDFGSIIFHLFNNEDRIFYNLERIWGDAKEIKLEKVK